MNEIKALKIVLICDNYLPFVGGVETHAHQVAQWMGNRHNVSIVAMNFAAGPRSYALAALHHNLLAPSHPNTCDGSIPVNSLSPGFRSRLVMAPMVLRAAPKLRRWFYHSIIRITHPSYHCAIAPKLKRVIGDSDVVHSMANGDLGWSAAAVARHYGVPFVCTPFVHPNQWGDGPNDRRFYRSCDALIGLVKTDAQYLISLGVEPSLVNVIGVSPNLSSLAQPSRFREKYHLGNKHIVLYVGRMMAQKGAAAVVQAARLLERQCHDYAFVFLGPATEAEASIFHAAPESVFYLGKVDIQDKTDAFAACDVFCMPSTSEILPTVFLEAWSYGKPVIGGMAEGLEELVAGNEAGVNVPQDPQRILQAVEYYRRYPEIARSHGRNGQRLVVNNYSVEAVGSQLLKLYEHVITKHLRRG